MSFCSFKNLFLQSVILTLLILSTLSVTGAQVRTSSSYQLQSDSINFAGGLSTSTNYTLEDTAGELGTGDSDSSTYKLRAGYQQMQEVFLSITDAADVLLTPNLGGITGGVSNGSTSVIVLTDSPSGYSLTIEAESAPAMQNGAETIADYVPNDSPNPDFTFTTDPSDVHFGFSPEGSDVVGRFRDNSTVCGTGGTSDTTLACWDGLSISPLLIAEGTANQPNGATTTLHFRVGLGGSTPVIAGTYIATTTLTAVPL
jgi:hypothetical protein